MKVTLRGGPSDMDGKTLDISGGRSVVCPVAYENPAYHGTYVCNGRECGDPKCREVIEKWVHIFNRRYEIHYESHVVNGEKIRKIYADYMGES